MTALLTITVVWAAGLALYYGLLRGTAAHAANRAFLLATLVVGLALPLMPVWSGGPEVIPALSRVLVVDLPTVVVAAEGTPRAGGGPGILLTGYAAGLAVALCVQLTGAWRLYRLTARGRVLEVPGTTLRVLEVGGDIAPFSFGRRLYVSDWSARSATEREALLVHEGEHARRRHSVDNVAVALAATLLWFHPLVYLLRRELRLVHEFQADAAAVRALAPERYRAALLSQQFGAAVPVLATSFVQSPLKLRFAMMSYSFRQNATARLLTAILALTVVGFACTKDGFEDADLAAVAEANAAENADEYDARIAQLQSWGTDFEQRLIVDTIVTIDPATGKETVEVVNTILNEDNGESVSFQRDLNADREPSAQRYRSEEVYKVVEQMPMFPGCEQLGGSNQELQECATKAMLEFIYGNIRYPKQAREAGIEGTAVVTFIVGKDGELLEPRIVRSVGAGTDEEVLRVVEEMPAWIPGKQDGRDVQVQFNLPIKFRLE